MTDQTDNNTEGKLTRADLAKLSPRAVQQARKDGLLDHLGAGAPRAPRPFPGQQPRISEQPPAEEGVERRAPKPNRAQGANGGQQPLDPPITDPKQLQHMSAEQINTARRRGDLAQLGYGKKGNTR